MKKALSLLAIVALSFYYLFKYILMLLQYLLT